MKMNKQNNFKFPGQVKWIAGPGNILSRLQFTCPESVKSAKLWIVADPHSYAKEYWQKLRDDNHNGGWLLGSSFLKYRLYLNGKTIGAGPFRPVEDGIPALHCFCVDLRKGENVLGVFSRGEKKGFALYLEAILSDGNVFTLQTDSNWKELNINNCYSPVCWERQNIDQFFKGCAGPGEWSEHIDGTKYPFGWDNIGFNDNNWNKSVEAGSVTELTEAVNSLNYTVSKVSPVNISRIGEDRWLVDFGQEYIGGLELAGPQAGGSIELCMGEELMPDNHVRYQMRTGNSYHEIWRFPAGSKVLYHFGLRSFRYLELAGYMDELEYDMISIVSVTVPFDPGESGFSCTNKALEQVWTLCKNTIAFTSMDVYNDCFSRERIVYEADTFISMLSHFSVGSNHATAKRSIEYLLRHNTWPCEWRQFMIPLFYEYAMHTGDLEFVERYYRILFEDYSFIGLIKSGLIERFPQEVIIDWPKSCRDNYDIGNFCGVPNAFLYWNLVLLSQLAAFLGKTDEYAELIVLAENVKTAFNCKLFNSETGLYIDSDNSNHSSFHINMFALRFGLVPGRCIKKCLDFIVAKGMVCSVYAAQFFLDVLFMYDRADEAIALMTANDETSWLGMIRYGATVTTEAWNPAQKHNMSWAHPWAASPANVIVRRLFGLRPTAPGWRKYQFTPNPGNIKAAEIKIPTPRGTLNAAFRRDNDGKLLKTIVTGDVSIKELASSLICNDLVEQ